MDARPRARALLLPRLPARAARPELAQPGAARGDARRAALLARPRRRRLPRRRAAPGRSRTPSGATTRRTPTTARGAGVRPAAADPQRRPRRPRAGAGDGRDDRRARRRDGRRAVPAVRAARALLRRRRAHALEHAPDLDAVGAARAGHADRGLRGGAAGGRVAELGARQPRPLARGVAGRGGAGAGRGDAAVHAARHADALLRRRARHDRRGDPARARAGPVGGGGARPGAHADAVDAGRRLHDRRAVAADGRPRDQRGGAARRPALDAQPPPRADRAAARVRRRAVRDGGGRRRHARLPPRARSWSRSTSPASRRSDRRGGCG